MHSNSQQVQGYKHCRGIDEYKYIFYRHDSPKRKFNKIDFETYYIQEIDLYIHTCVCVYENLNNFLYSVLMIETAMNKMFKTKLIRSQKYF